MSYHQGTYKLSESTAHKYKGNKDLIIFRSGWEYDFMRYLDLNKNIIAWNSEEVVVHYCHPIRQTTNRYFIDFWFRYSDDNNQIHDVIVEVKPYVQTQKPILSKTKTGRISQKRQASFENQLKTYMINLAKWESANLFAMKNEMKFYILTDDTNKSSVQKTRYKLWTLPELGIIF